MGGVEKSQFVSQADPYEQYDSLHAKLQESQKERDDLTKEYTRLKDQLELQQLKSSALGGGSSAQ